MLLDTNTHQLICKTLPVFCTDFIVSFENKYLLLKRTSPPLEGKYWLPGGRLFHQESLLGAARRILLREVGLSYRVHYDKSNVSIYGFTNMMFDSCVYGSHPYHTPAIVLSVELQSLPSIKLDSTSDEFIWSSSLPDLLTHSLDNVIS